MAPLSRQLASSSSLSAVLSGLLVGLLGLSFLSGCSRFLSESKPLSDSTFVRVLTEIHLAKARRTTDVSFPPGLRDSIFARYDVQPAEFDATLRYYSRHPEDFETLYQPVVDTLNALRYGPSPVPSDRVPDSLRTKPPRGAPTQDF